MRKILKIASAILLGVILIMNTGCARKGSRAWIERKVESMEKVYPTENAEDLFEKFPNGLKLNKDIFKQLELEKNLYTAANESYTIKYKITNNEINDYFNLNNEQIKLGVSGEYNEQDKTYFHTISVSDGNRDFYEKIVEEGENNEGDSE